MHNFLYFVHERLHEPSTWRGLVAIGTALGLSISPEQTTAIVTAGVGIIGLIGTLTPDRSDK